MNKKIFFLVLILAISVCQDIQTSTKDSITVSLKDRCNPILMRRLSMPTSSIPDQQAILRLHETIKMAPDPQTVLNDLSFYSPRFTGMFLNHIQSVHLFKKQIQKIDPETRTNCLAGFTRKSCSQICTTDIFATPQGKPIFNYEACQLESQLMSYNYQILSQQEIFQRFYQQTLQTYYRPDGTYIYQDDAQNCPSEASNDVQQELCFEDFWQQMFQLYYQYIDQSLNIRRYSLSQERPRLNLITLVDGLRRQLNSKFGLGVFAEKSLRCVRGDYLYMLSL